MSFTVYLKKDEGNQINHILGTNVKVTTVATLNISDGLLKKGNYYIPVDHILFIEEE